MICKNFIYAEIFRQLHRFLYIVKDDLFYYKSNILKVKALFSANCLIESFKSVGYLICSSIYSVFFVDFKFNSFSLKDESTKIQNNSMLKILTSVIPSERPILRFLIKNYLFFNY